ncbi:MAG: M48 family metalloprotease [Gammaproteobacteria bacterium]|nr:M48 family metalloprotease [Gammaproteobacteria bacterium]
MKILRLLLLLQLVLIYGCATNPATGDSDFMTMSEQEELEIGKQAHQQILRQYSVYNDLEMQNYVQYVGNKVAKNSHRPALDYTFTVLDSPEVNAFALPGGYIYISRGLMAYLNTEAELAAVLGHEVGHVTARHAARQQSASQLTGLGAAIGSIIGEAFIPGISSVGGQQLVGMAGTAFLRGYGREHELEADRLGAEYLAKSGYNPDAMLDVIGVLKNQELFELRLAREEGRQPRVYHGVFSTHPSSDTRLQEVVGYAHDIKEAAAGSTFIGRTEYLQRVDGMVYGESTDNGLVKGRDFYHGNMGFSMRFPERWPIQNLPDRLVASAPGGLAMVQVMVQPADPRLSPKDYMNQRMSIDTNSRNGQAMTVNGLPAYTTTAVLDTNSGRRLARVSVIYLGNMAFIIAGHTRDANGLNRYDNPFLATTRSFRPLSNQERQIANRTNRIRLVRAREGEDFDILASTSPLDKFPEEQLRLINAQYPSGDIKSGELFKVIQSN